jgi:hypothetical protein
MPKRTQKENSPEEILYSQCTPFILVQERKTKKQPSPDLRNPLLNAFKLDMHIGEEEAASRIVQYNAEVAELYDATMSGDELAPALLVELASAAIQALEQIAHRKPKALHPMSLHHIRWPAFIGHKEFHQEKNLQLMEKLKLGEKSLLKYNWNPRKPATFTAYSMFYWLLENQCTLQLPPFNEDTFDEWFECGWKSFCFWLKGCPEKYSYLSKKVEDLARAEIKRKQEKRVFGTVVRAKMKNAVKQAFKSVTKNYPA